MSESRMGFIEGTRVSEGKPDEKFRVNAEDVPVNDLFVQWLTYWGPEAVVGWLAETCRLLAAPEGTTNGHLDAWAKTADALDRLASSGELVA